MTLKSSILNLSSLILLVTLTVAPSVSASHIQSQLIFTSDKDAVKFGYDEALNFAVNGPYLRFQEGSQDVGYLTKKFTATQSASVEFRISGNPSFDLSNARLRVAFASNATASASAVGSAFHGGPLADSVQAIFKQDGSQWNLTLEMVQGGVATNLASTTLDGAKADTSYILTVNLVTKSLVVADGAKAPILIGDLLGYTPKTVNEQLFVSVGQYSYDQSKVYLAYTSPSTRIKDLDSPAPTITAVTQSPTIVPVLGIAYINATITAPWGVEDAFLHYTVNGGPVHIVNMTTLDSTQFAASIRGQGNGSAVIYWIEAASVSGSTSYSAKEYHYTAGSGTAVQAVDNTNTPSSSSNGATDSSINLNAFTKFLIVAGVLVAFIAAAILAEEITGKRGYETDIIVAGLIATAGTAAYLYSGPAITDFFNAIPGLAWVGVLLLGALYLLYKFSGPKKGRRGGK